MLLAGTALTLSAQSGRYRPAPNYVADGKADQAEGARILSQFHRAGVVGNYWLSFDLRVMPRKGPERTVSGQLLGARNDLGPITRLTLPGPSGLADEKRWLIQSGPQPATWLWSGKSEQTSILTLEESFQPLADTDLTPFDLQMPFLYWTDFAYEGVAKVRGRPAHSYVLYPPANLAGVRPGLTGVRVLLDTEFQAFLQAELLGEKGVTEKTITLLDLKKVGEQWLPKSIDLRNHVTRAKTRLTFTAVALDLTFPPDALIAASLAAEPPAVPAAKVEKF